MILHLSNQLARRLKCRFSLDGMQVLQPGRLDAWSGHSFRVGRIEHVMMMNDASLYTILLPAKGLTSIDSFLKAFLPRVREVWQRHGSDFDSNNQEVVVLKRANRSLIGSMNDAIKAVQFYDVYDREDHPGYKPMDIEERLNMVPYKALGYNSPDRLLPGLLGKG